MMISAQQVQLAIDYLHTPSSTCDAGAPCEVPPELLSRVTAVLESLPECRDDRVCEARDRFAVALPSSGEIAEKMIGRIISDSLR